MQKTSDKRVIQNIQKIFKQQKKLDKRSELTSHQRRYIDGKSVYENMLNMSKLQIKTKYHYILEWLLGKETINR